MQRDVGWSDGQCAPVGQDAAFAERLVPKVRHDRRNRPGHRASITDGLASARAARPLAEGSPLAVDHGTRYPILQGPMTRVSDVAAFRPGGRAGRRPSPSSPWRCCASRKSESLLHRSVAHRSAHAPGESAFWASCPRSYEPSSLPRSARSSPRLP